jgi:hypothetical protein
LPYFWFVVYSELKKASKRVILFTNQDDPTHNNADAKAKIVQKVKDMEELDIMLQCLPTDRPGEGVPPFNAKKFFAVCYSYDIHTSCNNSGIISLGD